MEATSRGVSLCFSLPAQNIVAFLALVKKTMLETDHHPKFNQVQVDKDTCKWCKKTAHYQKDCSEFLKHLMRKGEGIITFVDGSLYLSYIKSNWWIDSGATIHVANSL